MLLRRVSAIGTALAAALTLTSCATPAVTAPAPSASDPVCARVLQLAPAELAGQPERATTSQASRAWGDPAITLRCGVEPLGPTTDRCIRVTAPDGTSVDWVVKENDDVVDGDTDQAQADAIGRGRFGYTTYGRVPAIEVIVPVEYAGTEATALLVDLAQAVSATTVERTCL